MNMQNTPVPNPPNYECRAVEVLTSDQTGDIIGYCLGGGRPGPNLMVAGTGPVINNLFETLFQVPTLPWMWGKLYLIDLNELGDEHHRNPLSSVKGVEFDDSVILSAPDAVMDVVGTIETSYKIVLRNCAGMGMIAGRGLYLDKQT